MPCQGLLQRSACYHANTLVMKLSICIDNRFKHPTVGKAMCRSDPSAGPLGKQPAPWKQPQAGRAPSRCTGGNLRFSRPMTMMLRMHPLHVQPWPQGTMMTARGRSRHTTHSSSSVTSAAGASGPHQTEADPQGRRTSQRRNSGALLAPLVPHPKAHAAIHSHQAE
jgi:hypothetical protein